MVPCAGVSSIGDKHGVPGGGGSDGGLNGGIMRGNIERGGAGGNAACEEAQRDEDALPCAENVGKSKVHTVSAFLAARSCAIKICLEVIVAAVAVFVARGMGNEDGGGIFVRRVAIFNCRDAIFVRRAANCEDGVTDVEDSAANCEACRCNARAAFVRAGGRGASEGKFIPVSHGKRRTRKGFSGKTFPRPAVNQGGVSGRRGPFRFSGAAFLFLPMRPRLTAGRSETGCRKACRLLFPPRQERRPFCR